MTGDLKIILERIDDCNKISSHCKKHDLVIQAGSYFGHYPERLSGLFSKVITFEADPDNFIKWNNVPDNIIRHQSILGESVGTCGIKRVPNHSAQTHVSPSGDIPIVTIDSLDVNACDLIYLDIEGYELRALRGALKTIEKYSPVIAIEVKRLIRIHGYGKLEDVPEFFSMIGYREVARYNLDVVFVKI